MVDAPTKMPLCCLYGCLCGCCATMHSRYWAIGKDWNNYTCCQGQFQLCGFPSEDFHKSCPCPYQVQMCLEACCCTGIAMSSTRNYIMQEKNLRSDPCDNKLIRFNNALQALRIICSLLAMFFEELEEASELISLIGEIVFRILLGCMTAQLKYELTDTSPRVEYERKGAPQIQFMEK